jgi:tRNA-Thr(GGU) m(6)t(6)A37 methyltransferase TsaA
MTPPPVTSNTAPTWRDKPAEEDTPTALLGVVLRWLDGTGTVDAGGACKPRTPADKDVAVSSGEFQVRPIGWVRSPLVNLADAPKQGDEGAPDAELIFAAEFLDALKDVHVGDAILLLTWLDRAARDVLVVRPRDDLTRPERGVFSTRSADRPNPIGLHRVVVTSIDRSTLTVSDLEALDGTPIIDVKPTLGSVGER